MKHHHFTYSYKTKKILHYGDQSKIDNKISMAGIKDTTVLNFPIKAFYSAYYDSIYVFYR